MIFHGWEDTEIDFMTIEVLWSFQILFILKYKVSFKITELKLSDEISITLLCIYW